MAMGTLVAAHTNPLQVAVETADQSPLNTSSLQSLQTNTLYTGSGATETTEPACDDDGLESYGELEKVCARYILRLRIAHVYLAKHRSRRSHLLEASTGDNAALTPVSGSQWKPACKA